MRSGCAITISSMNKKPGKETATRLHRTRPAEKIVMVIFWDKYGILLTECLLGGTTIGGPYYALIIERLCYAILQIRSDKAVLVLHVNASIYKCNIVQAAIRKAGFVELNDRAYSLDIAHVKLE